MNYEVTINGLDVLDRFEEVPAKISRAVVRAINRTTEHARAEAAREIRTQANFPAHYLSGKNGRLAITKRAQGEDFEGIITGRSRPTSLARFSQGSPTRGRGAGVRVTVQPGLARYLPKAFFVQLRVGDGSLDTRGNLGLAIRLPAGQIPNRAYKPKKLGEGTWLLYGPSVDQVFRTVAEDISPDMVVFLEDEFVRLIEVDL